MNYQIRNQFKRLLAIMTLLYACAIPSIAASVEIDGLYYNLTSSTKTASLTYQTTGTTNYSGKINVVIPEKVNYGGVQYTVTAIENSAFANCTSLESISIPGTVTKVGTTTYSNYTYLPFYNCTELKNVRFEDGASTLYLGCYYASSTSESRGLFYYCPLKEVYLGRNIMYADYSSSYPFSGYPGYPQRYGYSAFYNQANLTKVTIGENVTSLPQYVFYRCSGLTYADFGSSLKSVPDYAFEGCSSLTAATLPFKTTSIGTRAFYGCTQLKSVSISGVTNIGSYAFYDNTGLSALELSSSLKTIKNYAFRNSTSLKSVSLPESLTTIENNSFENSGLSEITIPASVTSIGESCFKGSKIKKASLGENNITIGISAFEDCKLLTDITISSGQKAIPESCFSGCTVLINVSLSEGLTTINNSAFANCTSLESISIPGTITKVGTTTWYDSTYLPFYNCTALKNVRFEDGASTLYLGCYYASTISESRGLFYYCPLKEVYLGRNIMYADYSSSYPFSGYPGYPQRYGYSAFYNQANLTKVTIGDGVKTLPQYIFYGCSNIASFVCLSKNPASVGTNGFDNYSASLYYPNGASTYTTSSPWSNFTKNYAMQSEGNLMFIPTTDTEVMVTKYPGTSPESITVPASVISGGKTLNVTKVMDGAFADCENLTNVTFPSSVTEIGEGAFARNKKLASITFNGQKIIGKNAFSECTSITTLTLPSTLEQIKERAFYNIASLTQVSFGSSLKTIGKEAFASCGSLTAARMPNTLETLGTSAFENCVKLTSVSVGTNLTSLGSRAFFNCKVLSDVEIPGTTGTIGDQAFENCRDLVLVILNEGTKTIGSNSFKNCGNLTSMSIPGTVTTIGEGAFDDCIMMSSVSFLEGYNDLWIPYFSDCPIRTLRIGRNLKYSYGETGSPFRNKTSLNRVTFTGGYVTNLYNNLFDGCSGITSITLPSTLKTINSYVFHNCTGITDIIVPEGVTNIGVNSFENCVSLSNVILPSTLIDIQDYLFHNCTSLQRIELKEGLTAINTHAFDNCISLEGLTVPGTIEKIDSYVFEGCKSFSNLIFTDSEVNISLSAAKSLFRDCPLTSLYVGRNIDYDYTTPSNTPFYRKELLKEVTFSEGKQLTYILPYFIYGAKSLPSIIIPDNIRSAGKYAFAYCSALKSIQLSNSLPSIEEGLLQNCSALKALTIPASVQTVNDYALGGCSSLTDLHITDSGRTLTANRSASSKGMCASTALETLYIGRNLTYTANSSNGYSPFYGLASLKTVAFNMDGNINNLGDYYFGECSSVKDLDLPQSIVSVGQYGLYKMSSLENLTFPQKVSVLRNNLLDGCLKLPQFIVFKAVKSIESNVFTSCASLMNVTFEDSPDNLQIARKYVSSKYSSLFADCPIETLHLGRWLIYEIGDESWSPFYSQTKLVNLTLGETVGDIGKFLFEKCSALEKVEIPGVESVGEKSFYGCSKLKDVTFNTGTKSLGEYAFSKCIALDNLKLPSSVVSISDGCFMDCTSLNSAELGSSLEIIGPSAFAGCNKLIFVDIPESVYGLGVESFKGCSSLPYINIPKGISSVGARAFQGCTGVEWIILSQRCNSLGANSFDGCSSIKYIKSYNTNPPVGLPGFDRKLYETATVFAPDDFVEDYIDSDVWWEFYDIRPISGAIPVESIYLTTTEASLKVSENIKIEPVINPDNAFCKALGYFSNDPSIATVDDEGVVTGVSLGETEIVLFSKDGSGILQTLKIKVIPTLMERITLSTQSLTLRPNRQNTLTATIYPATTTNQEITWTSSRPEVAIVDNEGHITTVYDGETIIKAEAVDGSGTVAMCVVSVIPPMSGDSNDNDEVTISDAVNTANYAVGKAVENFNARAADVNGDNNVTLADASGTVSIVLAQDNSVVPVRSLLKALSNDMPRDLLVIDDFNVAVGETVSLDVRLDNSIEYVALQADICVPEGMTLENVTLGVRAEVYHKLLTRRIDERTVRIALFDISNHSFAENDEPLIKINVRQDNAAMPTVRINNILASDASAYEYSLDAICGAGNGTSGIDMSNSDNIRVEASNGCINVYNAEGNSIHIFAVDGSTIARVLEAKDEECFNVLAGIYIAVIGNNSYKVIIR